LQSPIGDNPLLIKIFVLKGAVKNNLVSRNCSFSAADHCPSHAELVTVEVNKWEQEEDQLDDLEGKSSQV